MPGTTRPYRLQENVGTAAVALTPADSSATKATLAQITVAGDRYPAHLQQRVGR
ncbi:aldo/keto reductase [Ralstonia pseudosolanacearum]|uniref:aldo/keto reductase n=1 Tax=Ralstonia pseudosolanacearum TaxID=1310165 RepID=UPI000B92EB12|nr:aldo/keto reductase [Ralstonia pseudosolanacearum]